MSEADSPENESGNGADESTMKTILYCKVRDALTQEDLLAVRDALNSQGYSLSRSDDGSKILIRREKEEEAVDILDVLDASDREVEESVEEVEE